MVQPRSPSGRSPRTCTARQAAARRPRAPHTPAARDPQASSPCCPHAAPERVPPCPHALCLTPPPHPPCLPCQAGLRQAWRASTRTPSWDRCTRLDAPNNRGPHLHAAEQRGVRRGSGVSGGAAVRRTVAAAGMKGESNGRCEHRQQLDPGLSSPHAPPRPRRTGVSNEPHNLVWRRAAIEQVISGPLDRCHGRCRLAGCGRAARGGTAA